MEIFELNLLLSAVFDWFYSLTTFIPNILFALIILVVFFRLSRYVSRLVEKLLSRTETPVSLINLFCQIVKIAVVILGVMFALGALNLDKTVTSILAGLGIMGIALGFAFKDIAENFISGIILIFKKPFREGDLVKIGDTIGTVRRVEVRTSEIETFQGQIVHIPNKTVFQSSIINYSQTGVRRVDIECGVGYESDLEHVRTTAIEAIGELDYVLKSKDIKFFYNEFGESSIDFSLRFWITFDPQGDFMQARSDAIIKIKQAFDREGINIPFPIRTIHSV